MPRKDPGEVAFLRALKGEGPEIVIENEPGLRAPKNSPIRWCPEKYCAAIHVNVATGDLGRRGMIPIGSEESKCLACRIHDRIMRRKKERSHGVSASIYKTHVRQKKLREEHAKETKKE